MRRGSVVGPLILILIGVLFLARNLYPNLPLLDMLAQYWPFLLIGWGVLRLLEILYWAATSKPLPVNGVSGGEWVLVFFLCLIGSGLWAVRHNWWWSPGSVRIGGLEMFGEAFDYSLNGEKACGKTPRIIVESFRGNARITGADVESVKVAGRKTVRALNQADADRANQDTPFEVVSNGDQVIIRTNQDRATNSSRVTEDMEITVPKGTTLIDAKGRYGDFDVSNIAGEVDIVSDNAGVRLQTINGNVRVETRRSDIVRAADIKGSVELKGRGGDLELENIAGPVTITASYGGAVQFRGLAKPVRYEGPQGEFGAERVPGQVRITRGDFNGNNVTGPIRITSRTQDVQLSDFTQSLEISIDRGDVELRPGNLPLPRIEARTRFGAIDFAAPDKAQFQISATTHGGEVTNDFGGGLNPESQGRGMSLRGSIGQGPQIVLETNRGSITIRKASVEQTRAVPEHPPLPPKPPEPLRPIEQ
jgi:DUF4097 and DUF4098 domain-containing protein YvlB